LMVGFGMHTTQTAGLALATDLATEETRPRVVALLYVMLLVGMLISSVIFGRLLADFSAFRLIQVIQGAAMVTMILNFVAVWKQEVRNPALTAPDIERPLFETQWNALLREGRTKRLLVATGLGAAAFSMQDVLLEPYGAEVLGMSVGSTTSLTAIWALGTLGGFTIAAQQLAKQGEPHRLAGYGGVIGAIAFAMVIMGGALTSPALFCLGVFLIGIGGGLFSVGTLTAAMSLVRNGQSGLALGAWGAVQATCSGVAIAISGALRDTFGALAMSGTLGAALKGPETGYGIVYHIEIMLLFAALIAIGPLAKHAPEEKPESDARFGLTEFPT
jgi:MFS transporter, BCD family, chlorophyll transporter